MITAIILSGGTGTRMGSDIPKQYMNAGGRPVISYVIDTFEKSAVIDSYVIVAADAYRELIRSLLPEQSRFKGFADPGENRQLSILSGLRLCSTFSGDDDGVIIHDAARPLVKDVTLSAIAEKLGQADAVLPILPMKDTVYEVEGGEVIANLDRSRIAAGQAPEGFRLGSYLAANESLLPDRILDISGSMQPAVISGMKILTVPGDEDNFKITTPADLKRFEGMICR